jgi:hypothetical protein
MKITVIFTLNTSKEEDRVRLICRQTLFLINKPTTISFAPICNKVCGAIWRVMRERDLAQMMQWTGRERFGCHTSLENENIFIKKKKSYLRVLEATIR